MSILTPEIFVDSKDNYTIIGKEAHELIYRWKWEIPSEIISKVKAGETVTVDNVEIKPL